MTRDKRDRLKEVSKIFCSSRPTTEENRLVGREDQIFSLGKAILTPCRHAIVYGARGVGKTSLVKAVVYSHCSSDDLGVVEYVCGKNETPETILFKLLESYNLNIKDKKAKSSYKRKASAKAKIVVAEGGGETTREDGIEVSYILKQLLTPDYVASGFKDYNVVYCIDEFDRVKNYETVSFVSELMKALSDYNAGLKIVICGVADGFSELFQSHSSISRCLDSVPVPLLTQDDIREIINAGSDTLHLEFDEELTEGIVFLSSGLPYFTHLLCEELSFNSLLHNSKSASLADLFVVLKGVLVKITGSAADEYALMEARQFRYDSFDESANYSTPTQIKRFVVHALSLSRHSTSEDIFYLYNKICELSGSWFPDAYIFNSDAEIMVILDEIIAQSSLITKTNGVYNFANPYYKAYALLQCADEVGGEVLRLKNG